MKTIITNENIFTPSNLFATPESIEDLQEYVGSFTGPGEQQLAVTIMAMTWNLASKLYAERHIQDE